MSGRGAVLLFVLILVTVLSTLAVQAVRTSQLEVFASYAGIYADQAEAMAESGLLAAGELLLSSELRDTTTVNLTEDWAYFPDLPRYPGRWFLDGHLRGAIQDETGKFPVNSLHPDLSGHEIFEAIFLRLLTGAPYALPPQRANALLAALVDWLDPDDALRAGGAEDAVYAADRLPYKTRNDSLDTLAELLLVRGFSRDLLYGRDGAAGLMEVLTVWGPGLINVNTAPLPVLAALPTNVDATRARSVAEAADAYRRDPVRRDSLGATDWLQKAVPDQGIQWPMAIMTSRSRYFSVTLEGRSGAATKRLYAVLRLGQSKRGNKGPVCEVLYRELR
ncbi:MAG: type II secretion system minor pseudopilin GspK [Solidesulfovibrio sp.]|uniref:type II secretion system minor pseudopilin GspK n=1 Tax=Solidesulfovibrio sp. TaxID=2910990 RepID=UPI002B20D994|nr:type II secretion system minor pseudopilin GspK [Solidesulfovibrio sp.]MEA4858704.1 type II secretion system minor pseudopilin GspK [Solidesulfovibrio sp.]